jgi:hypothetical protein
MNQPFLLGPGIKLVAPIKSKSVVPQTFFFTTTSSHHRDVWWDLKTYNSNFKKVQPLPLTFASHSLLIPQLLFYCQVAKLLLFSLTRIQIFSCGAGFFIFYIDKI